MYVVALAELCGPVENEAAALSVDLGITVYEARLSLSGVFPTIIFTTHDRDRAVAVLQAVRGRGHSAVACDTTAVRSSADMISMRRFAFEADAIVATDRGERLPFHDVAMLLLASHRQRVESESVEKERHFRPGMAIATGGFIMSKTVVRETRTTSEDRQQVLYIFRGSGATPWLLHEAGTHFLALGGELAPSRRENFLKTVELLRSHAPHATYDDRLMTMRRVAERASMEGNSMQRTTTTSSESGMDLAAHVLALWISKTRSDH